MNHRTSQRGSVVDNCDDEQQMASLLPSDLYAAINDDGGTISTGPSSVAEVFQRPFPRQEELAWIFAEQRRRRLFDGSMCVRMCCSLHAIRICARHTHASMHRCVTYGMEPIEHIAADYRNTRCVYGNEGPEVRDVPHELLESLTPCLEIARGADEPTNGHTVVFRSSVLHR